MEQESNGGIRLGVAVCAYRRPKGLREVLDSLSAQSRLPVAVYVIDNDPGGSAEAVTKGWDIGAQYYRPGENLGPAGAFAKAIEMARSDLGGSEWLVLVGDDNPLANTDLLQRLAHVIARVGPQSAVVAVGLSGARFDPVRGPRRLDDSELKGLVDVDYITGGGRPCYKVGELAALGVHFDPTLFFGFEEMDVGLQIRRAGGRVVIDGDWLHAARARAGKLGRRAPRRQERARAQWRTYYSIRNYLLVSRRHCSSVGRVRAASLAVGMVLRRALVPSRWSDLAPALAGLRDGLLGVTGRVLEP